MAFSPCSPNLLSIYLHLHYFSRAKKFFMKKVLTLACLLLCGIFAFAQNQVYIGLKGGIAGCFYQFTAAPTSTYFNQSGYAQSSSTKLTSRGPSIPALFELIYSTKKFRVGYQFEYERILTTAYTYKTYNVSLSVVDTTVTNPNITQHFFCHNLLIEGIVWDNHKNFRLVPDLTFGYFHGLTEATEAPYDFSSLNANRFKIGVALNGEYYFGPYAVTITPNYSLVPIKSLFDANQKGYMHFVGLHIGMRFGLLKHQDDTGPDSQPKKKKKEYKNPEEEE